jgi:hypothetical protein
MPQQQHYHLTLLEASCLNMTVNRNGVDQGAISKRTVTAKGNLIVGTANSVVSNLAVGNDGEQIVADSSTSTGLSYQANWAAGKNAIINGDFRISQRGTTFTNSTNGTYTLDRFSVVYDGTITSHTVSQQTFTPGTAPVAGYEGANFARWAITTNGTSTYRLFTHRIEDVRKYAGQTVTFSFWMKADSARTLTNATYGQNFGSGGSGTVESTFTLSTTSLTTSWQRITGTATVPSISGKTIGTGSNLFIYLSLPSAGTFDTWGWQLEAGSVATAFQTATGTLQGELAACQRYYYRNTSGAEYDKYGWSMGYTTTNTLGIVNFPVTMRTAPSALDYSGINLYLWGTGGYTISSVTLSGESNQNLAVIETAGSTSLTQNRMYQISAQAGTSYLGFSAEL